MACLTGCGGGCSGRGPDGGTPVGACRTEAVPFGTFDDGDGRVGVVPVGR